MIIIFCPKYNATGGTELLHQLGYKLNLFGYNAGMYYYGEDNGMPGRHPSFIKYDVPIVESVYDSKDNIFVYPEAMAYSLAEIKNQLPLSKHILWWLSVDNAGMTPELEERISEDTGLIHFVQSYYAMEYVRNKLRVPDGRCYYLSDYLNTVFLNIDDDTMREDIVLFNPRKGYERTSRLIKSSDHRIKWQALAGLPPKEIPGVLQKAKVYIDFGNHPGKDRFPREAVSCGVRIITGRRGSAANDKDVPILDVFKISDESEDRTILAIIYSLIADYEKTGELYASYKDSISEEFHCFEEDTLKAFSKVMEQPIEEIDQSEQSLRAAVKDTVIAEDYRRAVYLIAVCRIRQVEIDEEMMILEGYTRMGIEEHEEALYLMNRLLRNNDKNYEAYLIKARALLALGRSGIREALDNAVRYCAGTEDEEYVRQTAEMIENM